MHTTDSARHIAAQTIMRMEDVRIIENLLITIKMSNFVTL